VRAGHCRVHTGEGPEAAAANRNSYMGNSLAEQDRAITILAADAGGSVRPDPAETMPKIRAGARRPSSTPARRAGRRPVAASANDLAPDTFYKDLVWNLRNGVLAVSCDGRIAVMNEVAYRIIGLKPRSTDIGQPFSRVLQDQPELSRIIAGAFELSHLPNRAELRLKSSGKVIGYTLSQVRDASGHVTGAALFFKDLTRVEQLEERERLRDRLAALGEMAAAIAHEVKNPLAGIEVMAGLLKRQLPESQDAQTILGDIIKEAKMANAIVLEVLEFVRPIRLQVERIALSDVIRDAIVIAEGHVPRRGVSISVSLPQDLASIQGDPYQLRQLFTNLLTNAFEALGGRGSVGISAVQLAEEETGTGEAHGGPSIQVDIVDDGPGVPPDVMDRIFSPFFTTKPQGSGLGLAIVRKIVDAHDGRIDVRARATGGTHFRVTLPVTGNHQLFGQP
jgi:signal transduction histidine kinase